MLTKQRLATDAIVVTGASSGIGEACVLRLDDLGFQVFACVRREQDAIALQHKSSDRLIPLHVDVTDPVSIRLAADTVMTTIGKIQLIGLVNNAGLAIGGPLEILPISEIRKQLEVNVVGQIAVTQAFLPLLRQSQGRIINVGSLGGRIALPFNGPYHASKFALEALTDSLRVELRPWGIRVVIIEPGAIATPLWEKSLATVKETLKDMPQAAYRLYGPVIPTICENAKKIGKAGSSPEEVVKTIVHALTARRPRTRYLVGRGTRIGTLVFQRLPDALRDSLIYRLLMN